MKLVSFSITNYRSIITVYKLQLSNYAVLVGPNNEGKSNILKALVTSLTLLTKGKILKAGARKTARYLYGDKFDYDWQRDFPVDLQNESPEGRSNFTLEFELSPTDALAFKEKIGSNLVKNLKVKISCGNRDILFDIVIQGKAKKQLTSKKESIADFIKERVLIQYIPSIRTSELAVNVIENLLSAELTHLEENPSYQRLIDELAKSQHSSLDKLSKKITETVSTFIPDVSNISLEIESGLKRAIRNSCRVQIDDGVKTDIQLKGDGVISLTAISLLRHLSQEALGQKSLILAVEEPESHLHPSAIHKLRKVLTEIAQSHQVFISTHAASLVDRQDVKHNIIVQRGTASPAKELAEVRTSLGVELSDNLTSAYLILLVEGTSDQALLKAWLTNFYPLIGKALSTGQLALDNLNGADNLTYKAGLYRNNLCNVHTFLDYDDKGRQAVKSAISKGIITEADYHHASCMGMRNSVIEDLINTNCYIERFQTKYGVDLSKREFKNNKYIWPERIKRCFLGQAKQWDDETSAKEVKNFVCTVAQESPSKSLSEINKDTIDVLAHALIDKLSHR